MDCLTRRQLVDYYRGNKTEACETHLADCESCRAQLLRIISEENPDGVVSPALTQKTINAVTAQCVTKSRETAGVKRFVFPMHAWTAVKFSAAAGLVVAVLTGYFIIKSPLVERFSLQQSEETPSFQAGTDTHRRGGEDDASPETVSVNKGQSGGRMVFVFDSITVRVGKIPVARDRDAFVRFGEKTGIAAEPATVINVKARSDTTAYIELTKGTALFSIEKNKYREFIVQTPTVRIVAIGTVFSVMADSAYTMVNVVEGAVKLEHQGKSSITTMLMQGDGAFANRDSIINVMIENSQMLKARGKLLRDYIEGTMYRQGTGVRSGSFANSRQAADSVQGQEQTELKNGR